MKKDERKSIIDELRVKIVPISPTTSKVEIQDKSRV